MTGFVFLRVRAHRLLLAAALLAVLLTTSVLSALTAFSGSIGDAALRHTLQGRDAAAAALVITAQVPASDRVAANEAASKAARESFDGLPVTVRKLERSGSYALPRALQPPAAREGDPDLTHFATLDRSRVRLVTGSWPTATSGASAADPVQVAFPEEAATELGLKAGTRLTLLDRLGDKPLTVRVTGIYQPADLTDPYWKLDTLSGQGVQTITFTTYGPLLTDPALFDSGRLQAGDLSWLAAADFRDVTTGRIDALRAAAERGPKSLAAQPVFADGVTARTTLPSVLDRTERALLVSRSTLLIVAVQLVLLAACALLLAARLLSTERTGESELLRARGGSRRRIAWLATVEALLLALPAALCAPLLAGPLTRLLVEHGGLDDIGLRLGDTSTAQVWLTGGGVALACAAAVVAPALASAGLTRLRRGRAGTLPGPVRAGADVGLLLVAAVAYWQLDRQTATSGSGALSGDSRGELGVDPLLVAAPALALLAGTVLTLRLLPPVARLAERRAASGAGLSSALAGWQFSRRPLRGAGPVLLLVLAVAMGMLAIGQSASWDRSQEDQADFRTGASLRVLANRPGDPGQAGIYAALPGVRAAAPAHRTTSELSADRTATVLALDTGQADERMLLRDDLSGLSGDDGAARLLDAVRPPKPSKTGRVGVPLPEDTRQLRVTLRLTDTSARNGVSPTGSAPFTTVLVEDRYGIGYRLLAGEVPVDGRPHTVTLDLAGAADAARGPGAASTPLTPAGPLALTGLVLDSSAPYGRSETHRVSVDTLKSLDAEGAVRPVDVAADFDWRATLLASLDGESDPDRPLKPVVTSSAPLAFSYQTGVSPQAGPYLDSTRRLTVHVGVPRPEPPAVLPAIATDTFLRAAGAKTGQSLDVEVAGDRLRVKIVRAVGQLPTTGPGALSAQAASESADSGRTGDGGGLLLDLRAVNQVLADRREASLPPTEWWLSAAPGRAPEMAETLRARSDVDPAQVMVREETAEELLSDPLGVGPQSALLAAAIAAAALAAVGFAVSAAGSLRERAAEFALLRALGTPRRQLARLIATEQGLLLAVALLVGLALGSVLTRAVVPLVVLTGQATQPVPAVLVELPAGQVAALLAGVSALPLLLIAYLTLRRTDPAVTLRERGGN